MDPNRMHTAGPLQDGDRHTSHRPPWDSGTDGLAPDPEAPTRPAHHAGRHWLHLLMCAPMLLVVGFLVLTGKAGGGSIFYAVGCMAMMGVMMAIMSHGASSDGPRRRP